MPSSRPHTPSPGFLLDRGRYTRFDVPDAITGTSPGGINNRGQVVGEYQDAAGRYHGFLWQRGRFTTLDVPGAAAASALAINDHGDIVGSYGNPDALTARLPGPPVRWPGQGSDGWRGTGRRGRPRP